MSASVKIAKIAVSSALFTIDKPFDYLIPEAMGGVERGRRVLVPFGKGNKIAEGFVLSVEEAVRDTRKLKAVSHVFDAQLALSESDIALALWMRNRYFASFFECADAMLPPGIWERQVEEYFIAPQADLNGAKLTPTQKKLIKALSDSGKPMSLTALKSADLGKNIGVHLKALIEIGAVSVTHRALRGSISHDIPAARAAVTELPDIKLLGRMAAGERRAEALRYLIENGDTPEKELIYQTGSNSADLKLLEKKGYVQRFSIPRYMASNEPPVAAKPFLLSGSQKKVYDGLLELTGKGAGCALLHGITGSGKTAIYIELIRTVLSRGRTAMMLVPEIALTPQMLRGFRSHFGDMVAVIHSGLDGGVRFDEYMRVKSGRARVVIGTRSAVFAPLENMGVVIIDEEHENSYKSETAPRYSAIEVAKYRCAKGDCLLVLGSATPSVESYHNALEGKYKLFTLTERFNDAVLPDTIVADMKESLKDGDGGSIGWQLRDELEKNLRAGEQTILFLNRRGSSKMAMCADCGHIPECENCSVSLTYHSANGRLMCHHCGYSSTLPDKCPECGGSHIKLVGTGTQRIETELAKLFPNARVLRMDADTTTGRRSHEEILDAFGRGEADILVGTQMVAKGLDFPNVTLVGVIDADLSLYNGSYLAGERSFSLISQVVGRAGRRAKPGRAVIQTFSPKNPVIEAASRQDYIAFYDHEITIRELIEAPPFYDIFTFFLSGEKESDVKHWAETLAEGLRQLFAMKHPDVASPVLGPAPAAIAKISNKYRYIVTFKGHDGSETRRLVREALMWIASRRLPGGVTVAADINALYN